MKNIYAKHTLLTAANYDPYPFFNKIYLLRGKHSRYHKTENKFKYEHWIRIKTDESEFRPHLIYFKNKKWNTK